MQDMLHTIAGCTTLRRQYADLDPCHRNMRTDNRQFHRYTVAATTIWSGASYVYTKDAVKILSQKDAEAKEQNKPGP